VHGPDAQPTRSYPELTDTYLQRIAFNPGDRKLYAVANDAIASLIDGIPTPIAKLEGPLHTSERRAIGVAPGVVALIPLDDGSLLTVPSEGSPSKLARGSLTSFAPIPNDRIPHLPLPSDKLRP
jgi:hypothetical protein